VTTLRTLSYPRSSASLIGSVFLGFFSISFFANRDLIRGWRTRQFGMLLNIAIHGVIFDRAIFVILGASILLPFVE